MMIDVYHRYDFRYDEKKYMKNLKNVIVNKGYKSLSLFHELLKSIGILSYETARSYYNLRRIVTIDVLVKICNKLEINANEIMFPDSIPQQNYSNVKNNLNDYTKTFNTIFYIYNIEEHPEVSISNDYIELEEAINKLSLILSKYNYLLQKYYFADLCNDELNELGNFTVNFIVDRKTNNKVDWSEFILWKKQVKTNDFLQDFYDKYTFGFHDKICAMHLKNMKNHLPDLIYKNINELLPIQDRNLD